jgi:hypothetical protein
VIPYINASLKEVRPQDVGGDDYDTLVTASAVRWSGAVGIYVTDQFIEVAGAERIDLLTKTRVEIPYDVGRYVQQGDVLTYTFEGTTHVRTVANVIRSQYVGRVQVIFQDA